MITSAQIDLVAKAWVKAQGELKNISPSGKNFYGKPYVQLSPAIDEIRPILLKYGLLFTQTTIPENGYAVIQSTIMHESGQFIAGQIKCKLEKETPQVLGAALSYCRRVSLLALFMLSEGDDGPEDEDLRSPANFGRGYQPGYSSPLPGTLCESRRTQSAGGPAPTQQPEKLFSINSSEDVDALAKELNRMQIDAELWDDVAKLLDGKPRTLLNLNSAIAEVKRCVQNAVAAATIAQK